MSEVFPPMLGLDVEAVQVSVLGPDGTPIRARTGIISVDDIGLFAECFQLLVCNTRSSPPEGSEYDQFKWCARELPVTGVAVLLFGKEVLRVQEESRN